MRQGIRWLVAAVLVGVMLVSCGLPNPFAPAIGTPEIPRGGEVTISLPDSLTASQPWHITNRASEVLTTLTQSGLMRLDAHGAPQLELLESWQADPTGTVVTATLKADLLWSDAQPLTTADVLFTYTALQNLPVTTPLLHDLSRIKAVRAIDARLLVFTLEAPFSPLLTLWALPILPAHVLETQPFETLNLVSLNTGAGPFVFAEKDPDGAVHLRANPHYVRGAPFLDGIMLIHHDDVAQVSEGLANGSITIAELDAPGSSPFPAGTATAPLPGNELTALVYNTRAGQLFATPALRSALRTIVDTEHLDAPAGMALTAAFPFAAHPFAADLTPPVATVTATEVLSPTALLASALEAAGWHWDAAQGSFLQNDKPLTLALTVDAAQPHQRVLAEQIAVRWSAAGIKTTVTPLERDAYLTQFIPPFDYDVTLVTWGNGRSDTTYADTLLYDGDQSALFARAGSNSGMPALQATTNLSGFSDAAYEKNTLAAQRSYDYAARTAAERAALAVVATAAPVIPLARPVRTVVWAPRLAAAGGAQKLDTPWYLWGVEQWYLTAGK